MPRSYAYRTIVVGVDFSPSSREALARAADLAVRLGARLDIVHVVRELRATLPFSRRSLRTVAELQRNLVAEAREKLESWTPTTRDLDVRTQVLRGLPSEAILAHATKQGADLIVLGNLGHSSFEEILIGSTSERCLRRATVPVLLVPSPSPRPKRPRAR